MPTPEDLRALIEKATPLGAGSLSLHCEVQLRDFLEAHAAHFLALWEAAYAVDGTCGCEGSLDELREALAALKEAP